MIARIILILLLLAAAFATASSRAATVSAASWSGQLQAVNGQMWRLQDRIEPAGSSAWRMTRRVFDRDGQVRYASRIDAGSGRVDWVVEAGHPAQRVRLGITPNLVIARDAAGRERWRAVPDSPVCLPELMAEFAVQANIQIGDGGLRCLVPIDKAKKLAPLRVRRLSDTPEGSRRYEVRPGSLGMRLFFSRQQLVISRDGRRLLDVSGQLEVAQSPEGGLRYVEGSLDYATPRVLQPLPGLLLPGRRL